MKLHKFYFLLLFATLNLIAQNEIVENTVGKYTLVGNSVYLQRTSGRTYSQNKQKIIENNISELFIFKHNLITKDSSLTYSARFDKRGNRIKEFGYFENRMLIRISESEYNENNLLVKKIRFDHNDAVLTELTYKYDEKGSQIEHKTVCSNKAEPTFEFVKYNSENQITKVYIQSDGKPAELNEKRSYKKDNCVIREFYFPSLSRTIVYKFEYDSENNLIKVIENINDLSKEQIQIFQYDKENRMISSSVTIQNIRGLVSSKGKMDYITLKTIYQFDEESNVIKELTYYEKELVEMTSYSYNKF